MAFIENRRIRRKLVIAAIIAGGILVICGITVLIVLLAINAKKHKTSLEPNTSETPTVYASAEASESAAPTAFAEPTPTTESDDSQGIVTPCPVQTREERGCVLLVMEVTPSADSDGNVQMLVTGKWSMTFVNNTDFVMYEAMFIARGLTVTSAMVNNKAVRYTQNDEGLLALPFANVLEPLGQVEVYFEFSALISEEAQITLPRTAYDSVFDITAYVVSYAPISSSYEPTEISSDETGYVYRFELTGITELIITP